MHLQSLNANSPDESGKGSGRVTSNEQVHMYREMSSGALNRATYNKVKNKYLNAEEVSKFSDVIDRITEYF